MERKGARNNLDRVEFVVQIIQFEERKTQRVDPTTFNIVNVNGSVMRALQHSTHVVSFSLRIRPFNLSNKLEIILLHVCWLQKIPNFNLH